MKYFTFRPAISAFVVVGILLASLLQSVYGQQFERPKNSNIQKLLDKSTLDRTYKKSPNGERLPRAKPKFRCLMWYNCIQYEDQTNDHQWECSSIDGEGGYLDKRIVNLNGEKLNKFFEENGAVSGETVMVLTDARFEEDKIIIDEDDIKRFESPDERDTSQRRLGYPEDGILNTVAVRVNSPQSSPPSAQQLSANIFDDDFCLVTQYKACSYDQLEVRKYVPGTIADVPTVAPGVIEININIFSGTITEAQFKANKALRELLGNTNPGEIFDLVLFCFPPDLDGGGWLAYAYLSRWDSYYNDEWALKLSSQMHEVGHNLGLQHSGENTDDPNEAEYGDQSDMMGYSYFEDDGPRMCFNNAKNWQLGWYSNQAVQIIAGTDLTTEPKSYVFNGFSSYGEDPDNVVVMKIDNFFVGYNRAKKQNYGVREYRDMVTINEQLGPDRIVPKSKVAAALNVGDSAVVDIGYAKVLIEYTKNSNPNNINGKRAFVDISLVGEPVVCEGEFDASVEVFLKTDKFPEETSWGIADSQGNFIYYQPKGTYTDKLTRYREVVSGLCRGLEYYAVIEDSYGDGIDSRRGGKGKFRVVFEGSLLFGVKKFQLQYLETFTLPSESNIFA